MIKNVMRWLYQTFLRCLREDSRGTPGQDSADLGFLISLYIWFGAFESVLAL